MRGESLEIATGKSTLALMAGDITRVPADAIGNAANASLSGGGGVDGAIHRAGGPSIMQELDAIRARTGGCATGDAVVTGAGFLPAQWVLHAVGPVYHGGSQGEAKLLASCYRRCLDLADEIGARSVTFPAISTGVFGYPLDEAASVALRATALPLAEGSTRVARVTFVLYGEPPLRAFMAAARQIAPEMER